MSVLTDVAILVAGDLPAVLVERYGSYEDMLRRMLGHSYRYHVYDVRRGEWPARPQDHAAYVVTGSSSGVYDPLPWIEPLEGFIRAAHGEAKLIGICFGHQVMTQALGGQVEKSRKGWGIGLHRYDIVGGASWIEEEVARISVVASHQDQVIAPPAGATVLATSAFTPFAALSYAGGASISVQFHPEFREDFAAELVALLRPRLPDGAAADRAMASLGVRGDGPRVADWFRRFLSEPAVRPRR